MAKKGENRNAIGLQCSVCGNFIRPTEKNKANTTDKLEISKYCPTCNKRTTFKEKKNS